MGFDQLQKAVIQKAQKDAQNIIDSAQKEADLIKKKIKDDMDVFQKKSDEEINQIIDLMKKREIASSGLDAKKKVLLTKKTLIDNVFFEVKNSLNKKITKNQRKIIIESLVKKADGEIDVGEIQCTEQDAEFIKNPVQKEMLGGIIAKSKDKTTLVDYSFESMIDDIKDKHILQITNILFK